MSPEVDGHLQEHSSASCWRILGLALNPAAPELARSPLWLAQYGVDEPRLPAAWSAWTAWQWRGDARVDGVEKDVDLTRLSTEIESLDVLRLPDAAFDD